MVFLSIGSLVGVLVLPALTPWPEPVPGRITELDLWPLPCDFFMLHLARLLIRVLRYSDWNCLPKLQASQALDRRVDPVQLVIGHFEQGVQAALEPDGGEYIECRPLLHRVTRTSQARPFWFGLIRNRVPGVSLWEKATLTQTAISFGRNGDG